MFNKRPLFSIFALLIAPFGLHAATTSASQEQEYEQVRKIALRDPKVRAAYEEADRKLEAKILQIDPALASYRHHRSAGEGASAQAPAKPAAKLIPAASHDFQRSHVVIKGDTLSSISVKYGVTVAALKTANQISDERKLAVGQVLAIPNSKNAH